MTGMDQLGAWLAEDREREAGLYHTIRRWRCRLYRPNLAHVIKTGPTPDAAAKAAVEAARKEQA